MTFTAANGVGQPASQSFTLTVDQAPAITSTNNATFTVGHGRQLYGDGQRISGVHADRIRNVASGVSFNTSTGVLSGTPAAATGGNYPVTFTAANGVGQPASQSFTLTVSSIRLRRSRA